MNQPVSSIPYAACCQVDQPNPQHRDDMARNTQNMLAMLERAVVGYRPFHDIRLVVFPEFAHAAPVYETAEEIAEKLAVELPNAHTERLHAAAQKHGVWIQTGSFLEVDPRYPDAVFNTTVLISPESQAPHGIISKYRKVNPWIPWEVHASPCDIPDYSEELFPVAETELGRIGVATCYDWVFPEVTRELALGGAEILVRISAYMDPWGATEPTDWWTLVNRCRALENLATVVACNQGASAAHYPPFSWPGASMIVDLDGRILSQAAAGPGEAIVVGPLGLANLRAERARRTGHAMPAHLRPEAYTRQRDPRLAAGPAPTDRSIEGLEARVRGSARRLGW